MKYQHHQTLKAACIQPPFLPHGRIEQVRAGIIGWRIGISGTEARVPMFAEIPIHPRFAITSVSRRASAKHITNGRGSKAKADERFELRELPDLAQASACLAGKF